MALMIGLYGNRMVDLEDLKESDIDIYDIAHALSNNIRFNGHSRIPYSVAEHSVMLSLFVPRPLALAALLHDAAEAYIGDIIAPVKAAFPAIGELEHSIMMKICGKYGVFPMDLEAVKPFDIEMGRAEARQIMGDPEWAREPRWPEIKLPTLTVKSTEDRRRAFIERFLAVKHGVNRPVEV